MSENSKIEWTDHTWNPWQGCRKVSPGCQNCYMYRDKIRFGHNPLEVIRSKPATFKKPLSWKEPAKVFVCSWSDFFIEDADPWRDEVWRIIQKCSHLTFQILTKRPENIKGRLPAGWPFKNVWLGVTAENQEQFEERVPVLQEVPAVIKFISVEPMLENIYLDDLSGIDWVICGGESGANARSMHPGWARDLKDQCEEEGIPFFMKQMSRGVAIPPYLQGKEFPDEIPKKPSRIIAPPTRQKMLHGEILEIFCNDGQVYQLSELAKTIPLTSSALSSRLKNMGWEHPEILSAKILSERASQRKSNGVMVCNKDVTDLSQLSNRIRTENLFKIKEFTKFDLM